MTGGGMVDHRCMQTNIHGTGVQGGKAAYSRQQANLWQAETAEGMAGRRADLPATRDATGHIHIMIRPSFPANKGRWLLLAAHACREDNRGALPVLPGRTMTAMLAQLEPHCESPRCLLWTYWRATVSAPRFY